MKHTLLLGASPVPLVSRPSSLCVTHLIGVAFKSCTEMPFLTVGRVGRKQVKRGGGVERQQCDESFSMRDWNKN